SRSVLEADMLGDRFGQGRSSSRFVPLMAALASLGVAGSAAAQTKFVDFDTLPGGTATTNGAPITNQYSSVGVTFSGVANRQIGNYNGSYGTTGKSLLAFGDMTLTFSPAVSRVKFVIGAADYPYAARAYNAQNQQVAIDSREIINVNGMTFELSASGIV